MCPVIITNCYRKKKSQNDEGLRRQWRGCWVELESAPSELSADLDREGLRVSHELIMEQLEKYWLETH